MTSGNNRRIVCSYSMYSFDAWCLSVKIISLNVGSDLCLPLVSIVQQLLLVVQELFMCLRRKLKVRTLKEGKNIVISFISTMECSKLNLTSDHLSINTILIMMMYSMSLIINI